MRNAKYKKGGNSSCKRKKEKGKKFEKSGKNKIG
jgi:hypothetical protein